MLEFFRELDLPCARRARVLEDIRGLSVVVVRLNVSVLEFFRELDLLLVREGQEVLEDIEGQRLAL